MTTIQTIKLVQIANEALDYVSEVPALDPADYRPLVICESVGKRLQIVDGFHRTAGLVRWANENEQSLDSVSVKVIVCDDEDLISAAAEPGPKQAAALEAIYKLV